MLDLPPASLAVVQRLLQRHAPDCEARAFGSRVTGGARPYSDLDVALAGPDRLPLERLERIREAFEESDLPMRVELVDWHALPPGLRESIGAAWEILHRPAPGNIAFP